MLNASVKGTLVAHLGIEIIEIGNNFLTAKMPVDHRTQQPMGLLHGGASVVLSETLGSLAASLLVDKSVEFPVGLEINANHIKSVKSGKSVSVGSGQFRGYFCTKNRCWYDAKVFFYNCNIKSCIMKNF